VAIITSLSVPFEIGVGGHYHLFDVAFADAVDKLVDSQVGRLDSVQRGDVAAEDVIDPLAGAGLFEADEVLWLLDDADQ